MLALLCVQTPDWVSGCVVLGCSHNRHNAYMLHTSEDLHILLKAQKSPLMYL